MLSEFELLWLLEEVFFTGRRFLKWSEEAVIGRNGSRMVPPPDMLVGKVRGSLNKGHFGRILVGYLAFLAFLWNDTGLWPFY